MALKNLFDMVKADRYTADGREAIIKAQEEETEDKVYQIGEISQKTGLQKTANGWVKPKNGKQPGTKKEEPKNVHGAEVDKIYERQLKRIKELKAKGFTDEQIDNDKIIKQTKEDMKNVGKKPESKPAAQEEIGKFYTKFKDAQSAYDAGRQTFPEGGYKIYNTPQGYKVVDDPKTQQRMEAAGYEIEADVPEGTKPPKSPGEKPAAENKTVEKFDVEKWKTAPKAEKNSKLDWSHGVVGETIPVQNKSAEEKRKLITKYDSVGRLSRIGTKKNSYYNNKYGTFEVAGMDNDNVYIQEKVKNGLGSEYTVLRTIPWNEVEEINPFHDYGKRNPETGEETPTRPPLPEDAAPRVLTGDTKIRVRKA